MAIIKIWPIQRRTYSKPNTHLYKILALSLNSFKDSVVTTDGRKWPDGRKPIMELKGKKYEMFTFLWGSQYY